MRAVPVFILILLTGCLTDSVDAPALVVACPPLKTWTAAEQKQMAADEEKFLPHDSILWPALEDYARMRKQTRALGN